jgi:hypothetical protein
MDELKIIVKGLDRILFVVEKILENQDADDAHTDHSQHYRSYYAPPKKSHKDITEEGKRAENWNRRSNEPTL